MFEFQTVESAFAFRVHVVMTQHPLSQHSSVGIESWYGLDDGFDSRQVDDFVDTCSVGSTCGATWPSLWCVPGSVSHGVRSLLRFQWRGALFHMSHPYTLFKST
jgi:hypothetical protein